MKKLALISAILSGLLFAGDHDMYPNSVAITLGYSSNSKGTGFENSSVHGIRYNQNIFNASPFAVDAYQVSLDLASPEYLSSDGSTTQLRLGGNMLWYLDNQSNMTPFFLLGAGFSYITELDPKADQKSLSLYSNIGGGVEFQIRDDIAFFGEAKYIYEDPKRKYLNTNVGVKFSFGD